ncbi:alpha/beta hydrolase [Neorhizobium sp. P12A]|uniref:alpha/beta fold hydrolase n=1 Tax=Neorhizobium sp. P12A TaxID=2268027 RepID=UPI0011EEFB00|nr:alpha/beta hydrolase [Neorhizobium sp. P12A]KAA0690249.1 alpha/beta hydrolase [Neorhizobium sp. P12A]
MHSLQRNGIKLSFRSTEVGDPNLVFIHGWCCDHSYFGPQISRFQSLDYRVMAVDLRGHGQSAQPRQSYSMEVFADDVGWLCDELGMAKAYFIGHSMGGNVAYEVGRRRPDLAAGVVMIDSAVTRPAASRAAMEPFLRELEGSGYREALTSYVSNALVIPTDDRGRLAHILEDMTSVPQHVMISAFEGLRDHDPASEGMRLACAALYIAASEPQPRSDVERLRQLVPGLAYGQVVGSGHFCQLEVPDQVNAMIERFLALQSRRDPHR